jgi:hypothetical protein
MVHLGMLDWVLFLIAGYIAVTTLCHLVQRHREKVLDRIHAEWDAEQKHQKAAELYNRQEEFQTEQQQNDRERLLRRLKTEQQNRQQSDVGRLDLGGRADPGPETNLVITGSHSAVS